MPDDLSVQDVLADSMTLRRDLTPGTRGLDVARLQADLHRVGLPAGTIDGVFGDRTAAAVQKFCERAGLVHAGTVDAALWSALELAAAAVRLKGHADHADANERLAALHSAAATASQQLARDKRAASTPAGDDEERAAGELMETARAWQAAAHAWAAAAEAAQADFSAGARLLWAFEQMRDYAVRAANSYALAGKDLTAAGATGHEVRLAGAIVEARSFAAF